MFTCLKNCKCTALCRNCLILEDLWSRNSSSLKHISPSCTLKKNKPQTNGDKIMEHLFRFCCCSILLLRTNRVTLQRVPVASKQQSLSFQEGPGDSAARRHRLTLQTSLQPGHLGTFLHVILNQSNVLLLNIKTWEMISNTSADFFSYLNGNGFVVVIGSG